MKFESLDLPRVGQDIQLVGAIYLDRAEEQNLLCFLPEEKPARTSCEVVMDREEWAAFLRQADLVEVELLARHKDGRLAKAILRKSTRAVDQHINWAVFRRDGFRCRYCSEDNVPLTVDHLVTWEEGGPNSMANLVAACKKCNGTRSNTPYAEWLASPYYVRRSRHLQEDVRRANKLLVDTLADIPRREHRVR